MPLLAANRSAILQRWFQLIADSYPSGVGSFLGSETDRFANPVGQTIRRQIECLLDGLLEGKRPEDLAGPLDDIVRIRAVQDFTPSRAVGFVFLLKQALRGEPGRGAPDELERELAQLDGRIDSLVGQAFDVYMSCREKIYELKANELRRRTFKLLERMGDMGGGDAERAPGDNQSQDGSEGEGEGGDGAPDSGQR